LIFPFIGDIIKVTTKVRCMLIYLAKILGGEKMKKVLVMLCIFALCFMSLTTVSAKDTKAGTGKTGESIQTVSLEHTNPMYDEKSSEETSLGSISSRKWYAQYTSDFMASLCT